MLPENLIIRDATPDDLPALAALKPPQAIHDDRLRDAAAGWVRYLVIADRADGVVGFGVLVFVRPASWPDAGDTTRLPGVVDLQMRPDRRGQGLGTQMLAHMAEMVRARGGTQLYLSVDPVENPRALALYQRLGFTPLQAEPHWEAMSFVDSAGHTHAWAEWSLDMVKPL